MKDMWWIISDLDKLIKDEAQNLINDSLSHNNIKIDGTFEEWVASIAKEVERSLAVKSKEPDAEWYEVDCITKITPNYWIGDSEEKLPALEITVYMKNQIPFCNGAPIVPDFNFRHLSWKDLKIGSLGFCKAWFDKDHHPKTLRRILEVAFIDFMWHDIFEKGRKYVLLVKKLGLDCSVPRSFGQQGNQQS